jgi:hypothetical protein
MQKNFDNLQGSLNSLNVLKLNLDTVNNIDHRFFSKTSQVPYQKLETNPNQNLR